MQHQRACNPSAIRARWKTNRTYLSHFQRSQPQRGPNIWAKSFAADRLPNAACAAVATSTQILGWRHQMRPEARLAKTNPLEFPCRSSSPANLQEGRPRLLQISEGVILELKRQIGSTHRELWSVIEFASIGKLQSRQHRFHDAARCWIEHFDMIERDGLIGKRDRVA